MQEQSSEISGHIRVSETRLRIAGKENTMGVFSMRMIRVVGGVVAIGISVMAATGQTATSATSRIVSAANRFLATLDAKQRQSVLFAFDDAQQRARWSNLPTSFVPRGGISLKQMNATQRSAAMALRVIRAEPEGICEG